MSKNAYKVSRQVVRDVRALMSCSLVIVIVREAENWCQGLFGMAVATYWSSEGSQDR